MKKDNVKLQRNAAITQLEYNRSITQEIVIEYEKRIQRLNAQVKNLQGALNSQINISTAANNRLNKILHSRTWMLLTPFILSRRKVISTINRLKK